ncbi:MAG: acetyl-CoA carboxylase biotin carboxylase subunit [Deltaproteobacteria bacterium HGW-Deltaproteobacteria-15]|nr:MAG: acetyl-CoA carboxylase biotin carboxylase subunit [Deltaproteobacteria bacterium HGW-Deltaproteobacteria-15]
MLGKILVANRGEIAVRVMRACREMSIPCVAVYSEADRDALFVKYADEAFCIGPPPARASYLNIARVIEVAKGCGAEAIHPGYGFLAENPEFARVCEEEGIKFIGPSSRVLALMGDKVAARREMKKAGVPVVPGADECITEFGPARDLAREIGYPVIIKPSGGGGGIGMTVVTREEELAGALKSSQAVATNTFGICDVYIEKYLPNPRHIEFQLLGDSKGNGIHLGERECSIQRRHQKLVEESPSPAVTPAMRAEMGEIAAGAARFVGYEGAGTMEFLFSEGKFYFLEVNARVQVEHPVTEMVTGVDIVKEQIRIASGIPLGLRQEEVRMNGWALECRVNAEDPLNEFAPSPGRIREYRPPGGPGVRVDDGVYGRYSIPPFYDPMISKVIVWGRDRMEAVSRMRRALYEYVILGIKNNLAFHRALMENPRFVKGELDTGFIERETTLPDEMKRVQDEEAWLGKGWSSSGDLKRTAAVAAVAALIRR